MVVVGDSEGEVGNLLSEDEDDCMHMLSGSLVLLLCECDYYDVIAAMFQNGMMRWLVRSRGLNLRALGPLSLQMLVVVK